MKKVKHHCISLIDKQFVCLFAGKQFTVDLLFFFRQHFVFVCIERKVAPQC